MLIVESELAPLRDHLRRLFAGRDGEALAAFAPDGTLIWGNEAGLARLAGATTLSTFGIEMLTATALETGSARGTGQLGGAAVAVSAERLDVEKTRVLAVTLTTPGEPPPTQAAPQKIEPAPVAAPPQAAIETPPMQAAPEKIEPAPVATTPQAAVETPPVAPPPASPPSASAPTAAPREPPAERRHPLRFVWHTDPDGRFSIGSDEFFALVGPQTMAAALGRTWNEIADALKLDTEDLIAHALATRETWSSIVVSWPVDGTSERLPVELSGLPVVDRDRSFRGYRGFGVCRDLDRLNELARLRHEHPIGEAPPPKAPDAAPAAPASEPAEAAPRPNHPVLSVVPAAANVVPFRPSPPPEPKPPPTLSPVERTAFRELAQELTARLREPQAETGAEGEPAQLTQAAAAETAPAPAAENALLDRIPIGILIYRHDALLYANRHFLDWTGYESLAALDAAGGLDTLFAEPAAGALGETGAANPSPVEPLSIVTRGGDTVAAEGRMFTLPWNGGSALALILTNGQAATSRRDTEAALRAAEAENRELKSILDAATDGIVMLDAGGRIVTANARSAALFARPASELAGRDFSELLAPGSEAAAYDYFARAAGGANILDNVLDVEARAGEDRVVSLAMTISRLGDERFCAVFRDTTVRRQIEDELRNTKRDALRAAAAKADFLAKVSHEIRTPLNTMTGFAEVIMAERFGPIGNERYRDYLKDIHNAGTHLVSMLNDLLDLSKIESGRIELTFTNVNLNELTQQCVGIMQPQANRARIIIRTALTPGLPKVVADERSLRQIVLNLLSNAIKFTGPGGQVIVSTVFSDNREAVLRVRDTGVGMSEKDVLAALEPFRHTATSGSWGSGGTGFGLPLTKALAEANRANFNIKSAPNAGTLIEIAFPPSRVVAD